MRDLVRLVGFLTALGSALVHLAIAPEHMTEVAYIGWLFILGGGLLFACALDIVGRDKPFDWHLAALLCSGMVIGLLLSRTTGLPGGYREGWEPEAWASLSFELGFLGAYAGRLRVAAAERREGVTRDAEPAAEVQALGGQHDAAAGGGGSAQPR